MRYIGSRSLSFTVPISLSQMTFFIFNSRYFLVYERFQTGLMLGQLGLAPSAQSQDKASPPGRLCVTA